MPSTRSKPRRGLIRPATVIGGLVLLLVALALLAIPFLKAPGHATGARADLDAAKASLAAGDLEAAETSVQSARRHTDQVQGAVQGLGGDVWSLLPVVGGPVDDVRHLGNALDDLTSIAEIGVAELPQVNGADATLFDGGAVDLDALARLSDSVEEGAGLLESAEQDLQQVADERMVVGTRLGTASRQALDQVSPLLDGVDSLRPVLDVLPTLFGSNERRAYLVAVLNPSELRYSGGAALSLATMFTEDGRIELGRAFDAAESPAFFRPRYWIKVKGNRFHRGRQSIQTANYAPTWPVSGQEMLNAFRSIRNRPGAGLIVIDAVALGRLLEFTGPIEAKGYPPLTSDNFVYETTGNYDAHPDPDERRSLNKSLSEPFTKSLFTGGQFVEKMRLLHEMAQARHFAVYFRTPEAQAAFSGMGLTGDFPDTDHDFLGVFSQNTNIAKSDYWQRRRVRSDVVLRKDGSARVRLAISIHNDSPPALPGEVDPRGLSYTTRWNTSSVAAFLPRGAIVRAASLDGRRVRFHHTPYFDRRFVRRTIQFAPQARHTYVLEYDVPHAAVAEGDRLTYGLDLVPQGMVTPQAVTVRVRWPKGYAVDTLPAGWTHAAAGTATYDDPGLVTQPSFRITASSAAATGP